MADQTTRRFQYDRNRLTALCTSISKVDTRRVLLKATRTAVGRADGVNGSHETFDPWLSHLIRWSQFSVQGKRSSAEAMFDCSFNCRSVFLVDIAVGDLGMGVDWSLDTAMHERPQRSD